MKLPTLCTVEKTYSERQLKKSLYTFLSSLCLGSILALDCFAESTDSESGFSLRWPLPQNEVLVVLFAGSNPQPTMSPYYDTQSPFTPPVYRPNTVGDPGQTRTGTPSERKVMYQDVYPGIDLVCYGLDGRLSFDLYVEPWADPSLIRVKYMHTSALDLSGLVPAHQLIDGAKVPVQVRLIRLEDNSYVYEIGRYDKKSDLIISSLGPVIQMARK